MTSGGLLGRSTGAGFFVAGGTGGCDGRRGRAAGIVAAISGDDGEASSASRSSRESSASPELARASPIGGSATRSGAGKEGGDAGIEAGGEGGGGEAGAGRDSDGGGLGGTWNDGGGVEPGGCIDCVAGWARPGIDCHGAGGTGSGDGARCRAGGKNGARVEGRGAGGATDEGVSGGAEGGRPDAVGTAGTAGTTGCGDGGGVRWIRRTRGVGSSSKPSSIVGDVRTSMLPTRGPGIGSGLIAMIRVGVSAALSSAPTAIESTGRRAASPIGESASMEGGRATSSSGIRRVIRARRRALGWTTGAVRPESGIVVAGACTSAAAGPESTASGAGPTRGWSLMRDSRAAHVECAASLAHTEPVPRARAIARRLAPRRAPLPSNRGGRPRFRRHVRREEED